MPTLQPLPTLPAYEDIKTPPIGGVDGESGGNSGTSWYYPQSPSNSVNYEYYYYYPPSNPENGYYYSPEYTQSKNLVNYQKQKTYALKNAYKLADPQSADNGQNRVVRRGITLTTTFVKATQSSGPAILIGGLSLKVNNSWLLVVPVALFIIVFRRRHRLNIDMSAYLNAILEIIL